MSDLTMKKEYRLSVSRRESGPRSERLRRLGRVASGGNGATAGLADGTIRELGDLLDVSLADLLAGDVLEWDGERWANTGTVRKILAALDGKLDRAEFDELFEKEADGVGGWRIKAKYDVYSPGTIAGLGRPTTGSGAGGGATELRGLSDVMISSQIAGQALVWDGQHWVNRAISAGMDQTALAAYLADNSYAKLTDIPSLTGYAKETWVNARYLALAGGTMANTNLVGNLNADLLDGVHKDVFNAVAHYGTKDMHGSGYYKIRIKSATSWMLGFKVLAYQNYCFDEIDISGYNYGSNYWHVPSASLINSQGSIKRASINVVFGYDSALNLWVAIPAANYAGIVITDVANGYTQVANRHDLFDISYEETLTGTIQTTVTAARHADLGDNVASASRLQTARNIWGQSFDGAGNVSGRWELDGVASGALSIFDGSTYRAIQSYKSVPLCLNPVGNNVAIGKTTADYKLDVNGTARATSMYVGSILLEDDNGVLKINGSAYATGNVAGLGTPTTGSGAGGGATELRGLADVMISSQIAGQALVWDGQHWVNRAISTGLDQTALAAYLTANNYAKLTDIPSLAGYATETWVNAQGFLKSVTKAQVEAVLTGNITTHTHAQYLTAHQELLKIVSKDLRYTDITPSYDGASLRAFFQLNDNDGLNDGGVYNGILWFRPYGREADMSGGYSHELGFTTNGNMWHRMGVSATTWGDWAMLLDSANYASVLDARYYTESEVDTKLTDGSVTKLGTATVGSSIKPIYLNNGVPTECITSFGNNSGQIAWSNGTLCSNLNADMLDGLHATSFYATRQLFSKSDYQHYVVLLWKVSEQLAHRINGKLYTKGFGASRYQAGNIDLWYSRWSSGFDKNFRLDTFGLNTPWKLVTCTYNGESWYALQHTNTQAITAFFIGTSDGIDFTAIHYYTSNTSTVVNSEINSSIVDKTPELSKPFIGGNAYALVSDNVASATRLQTARTLWGQSFDGSGNVSGNMTGVGSINTYLSTIGGSGNARLNISAFTATVDGIHLYVNGGTNNARPLVLQNDYGNVAIGKTTADYKLDVNGTARATSVYVGSILLEDDNGVLKINGSAYATGNVAGLGAPTTGSSAGGGATELRGLADVMISSQIAGQALVWDGQHWVNRAISTGLDQTALAAYLTANNYAKKSDIPSLSGYYTKNEADGKYVTLGTAQPITGQKSFNRPQIFVDTAPNTSGWSGNAGNGFLFYRGLESDPATNMQIGVMSSSANKDGVITGRYLFLGWGANPYSTASNFAVCEGFIRYKNQDILHAGNYASMLDTRYLLLTGGTLTGRLEVANGFDTKIVLNNTDTEDKYQQISFRQNGVEYGTLGTYGDNVLKWSGCKIWHAGNDGAGSGLNADMLDGKHDGYVTAEKLRFQPFESGDDLNNYKSSGLFGHTQTNVNSTILNAPGKYGETWLDVKAINGSGYGSQLFYGRTGLVFKYLARTFNNSGFSDWREFAFTDSNVASATTLQTARTLTIGNTGKAFDGSVNVAWSLTEIGAVNKAGDTMTGNLTAPRFISNVATGTAPFAVSSTTLVGSLNADMLDGLHADAVKGVRVVHPQSTAEGTGIVPANMLGAVTGYAEYDDPEFASGLNTVGVYNNLGNGNVTITRMADNQASANSSGYILEITHTGNATPGLGGFYHTIRSRANAVFLQVFRAKIPVGYDLGKASNSMGTGAYDEWVTETKGTGRWEWYGRIVCCGASGSFATGGHIYLNGAAGSASAPVVWYVSHCQVYDLTKGSYNGLRSRFADRLSTLCTLWGRPFAGDNNVSGDMTDVGAIHGTASVAPYLQQSGTPTAVGNLGSAIGFGLAPVNYGLFVWGDGNGRGHIQVGRKDGNQTAYNLILQEFGGNVGVNTPNPAYKLDVNGTARATSVYVGSILLEDDNGVLKINGSAYATGNVAGLGAPTTGSGAGGGATELRGLADVMISSQIAGQALVWDGQHWINRAINTGLDQTALAAYLTANNYAKKSDIPSLVGYATETWVNNKGYITNAALSGYATQIWVNSQGFLKSVAWSTVTDKPTWIGASKPSYAFSELTSKPTTIAGYGITDAKIANGVITLGGNTITPLTAHQALNHINYVDHRSENLAPYGAWTHKGVQYALKYNTADGLSDGGAYHGSLTLHPWSDSSGGSAHQMGFTGNGNIWHRSGSAAWGDWAMLLDSANYASVLDGRYLIKDIYQMTTGQMDFRGGIVLPYSPGTWLEMATTKNQITAMQQNAGASAHSIMCIRNSAGHAMALGGLGFDLGFYGFKKSRIDAGNNGYDWATTWDVGSGKLTHSNDLEIGGALTVSGTALLTDAQLESSLLVGGESAFVGTTYLLGTTYTMGELIAQADVYCQSALEIDGQLYAYGGIAADGIVEFSDGFTSYADSSIEGDLDVLKNIAAYGSITAKGDILADGYLTGLKSPSTSDMRLKNRLDDVVLSIDRIADMPCFRYAWRHKAGLPVDVGTSAQYWLDVLPEVVSKDSRGYYALEYGKLAYVIVKALLREMLALRAENERMKQRIK